MTSKEVLASVGARKFLSPAPSSETNWKTSQLFCLSLADALKTYGNDDLPTHFSSVIEPYLTNIIECALSERTQLSVQGCRLLSELPRVLSKDMHPLLDRLLPPLLKHCASTKTVNQKSAAAAISNVVTYSTYSPRLLWHVTQAFEDKNVGPRIYAPSWLQIIIDNYQKYLHPERDYDIIAHAITVGLLDADLTVRTNNRPIFWAYHKIDSAGADVIKEKLNNHARTALENDPHNPDKKTAKPKPKKTSESEAALAQLRLQGKKRMQERMQERSRDITPQSTAYTEPVFGSLDNIDADVVNNEMNASKSIRDGSMPPPKSTSVYGQQDHHTIVKTAARVVTVHKKASSQDSTNSKVIKKSGSSVDLTNNSISKKTGSSEPLRTSQNKKSETSASEISNPRPFLSAPVRRPRIIATPMNVAQPTSRPSSRTGHSSLNQSTDSSMKSVRDIVSSQQESKATSSDSNVPSETLQPIKVAKKISRAQISSPVMIPDGKENVTIFAAKSVTPKPERNPSPTKRPLEDTQAHNRDFTQTTVELPPDTDINDARRGFKTGLRLLQGDQLDYMGFRKLKKLVCNFGRDVIVDQYQYDVLFSELLPRLSTIEELVYKGDPRDMKHPIYIRQAIIHMMNTLLSDSFHAAWRDTYQGPALAATIIARCCYTPNTADNKDPKQKHSPAPNSTVDLLNETAANIIDMSTQPLDLLNVVLDCLGATEGYLLENAEELDNPSMSLEFASFDRYKAREKEHCAALGIPLPPARIDDPNDPRVPRFPSKIPFFMETGTKVVSRLLERSRKLRHPLSHYQEDRLADMASHLLTTYNVLLRQQVMLFCKQLYLAYSSPEKFWDNFPEESDRNLLHYYLADAKR